MAKHNANVDVRGDLRVRGRIGDNLRVQDEVEASAFYIRRVGELRPLSFNPNQFYLTKDSKDNSEVNLVVTPNITAVTFSDGTHTFVDDTVKFNFEHFYLSGDSSGNPVLNYNPNNKRCWVFNGSTQAVVDGDPLTTITVWNREREDVGDWHESVTNPSRLTVPAGVNLVEIEVQIAVVPTGTPLATSALSVALTKNGALFTPTLANTLPMIQNLNTGTRIQFTSPYISCVPGDFFEAQVTTTTVGVNGVVAVNSWFAIHAVTR